MAVKDLKIREGNTNIELDIVDVGEVREFDKFGKKGRVATAIGKDETGTVKISLWNDDIDKVKAGQRISIQNGYVSEWQGEPQLTTGKFGKLEILKDSEETKKDLTTGPDEAANKEEFEKTEKALEDIEEKLEEKPDIEEEKID